MGEITKTNVVKPVYTDPKTGKFIKGNPGGGRIVGSGISITTEIKRKLDEIPEGGKATNLQLLLDVILDQALRKRDQAMITKIWNYIDGMPKQSTDITSGGESLIPTPIYGRKSTREIKE